MYGAFDRQKCLINPEKISKGKSADGPICFIRFNQDIILNSYKYLYRIIASGMPCPMLYKWTVPHTPKLALASTIARLDNWRNVWVSVWRFFRLWITQLVNNPLEAFNIALHIHKTKAHFCFFIVLIDFSSIGDIIVVSKMLELFHSILICPEKC